MMAAMIDTLQVSRRLRDAGTSEALAETLSETTSIAVEDLATKNDLGALESRIDNRILASENRILAAQNRMLVWIGGMIVAAVGLTATLTNALG